MTSNNKYLISLFKNQDPGSFLYEEIGTLVFQSALMRYLVSRPGSDITTFEHFVENHAGEESFLDDLCVEYPEFENLLVNEMQSFKSEVINI